MYKFVKKEEKITGIKCIDNNSYFTKKNNLVCDNENIIKGVEGFSFWLLDKGIYFHNNEGEEFLKRDNKNYKITYPFFVKSNLDYKVFCAVNYRRENRKWMWSLGLFDLTSLSLIKEFPFENYTVESVVDNNSIGYFEKNKISAFNIDNCKINWELDLATIFNSRLIHFIGVYENQLLIACRNHLLLSVDINTGEILHKWQELVGFEVGSLYKDVLPDPTNFVLDKQDSKLIGVFDTYYFEIDLNTKEISYYQLKEELSKYNIRSFRSFNDNPFTSEYLFLTAHTFLKEVPNVNFSSVLSLNKKTKKVDWVHTFKDVGLGTNVPQITDTHLYILDLEGTLHIFEKEVEKESI